MSTTPSSNPCACEVYQTCAQCRPAVPDDGEDERGVGPAGETPRPHVDMTVDLYTALNTVTNVEDDLKRALKDLRDIAHGSGVSWDTMSALEDPINAVSEAVARLTRACTQLYPILHAHEEPFDRLAFPTPGAGRS